MPNTPPAASSPTGGPSLGPMAVFKLSSVPEQYGREPVAERHSRAPRCWRCGLQLWVAWVDTTSICIALIPRRQRARAVG